MPQKPRLKKNAVPEDPAAFIAATLRETEELPRSQIEKIVKVLGPEASLALLAEVERIEESGGLLVPDGGRRRTPGGVFFHLARQKLPRPHRYSIFAPPKAPTPPAPPSTPPPAPRVGRLRVIEVEPLLRGARTKTWDTAGKTTSRGKFPTAPSRPPRIEMAPAAEGTTLPSPAPTPTSKKEFVLSFSHSVPAADVVEAARRQGISLSASYVYSVRKGHPPGPSGRPIPRPAGPVPRELEAVRAAVERELSKLSREARTQLLAALLYDDLDAKA